ncbi:hypothetical protein [Gallibacterium salpingitidis]|uniref:hypothetical protein n=1 Tax=Gallibacterium salpingitidis TaxID=505341 RepID=UPI0012E936A3|nr:hypothetical protein [Gallibacterium salpingitidis]
MNILLVSQCIEPLKMRNKINRDLVEKCWNKWVKKLRKMGLGEKIKPFLFVK